MFQIGCFSWYSDDFLDGIAAAAISELTGQKSLDRLRRQYSGYRASFVDHDEPAKRAVALLNQHMISSFAALQPRICTGLSQVVFDQAIVRAFKTIEVALYLARRGYLFETAMVSRGFIEQVVWARGALSINVEDDLFRIDHHKEISKSKATYPTIGRIYGELSRFTHFHADLHHHFYSVDGEKYVVRQADRDTKRLSMRWPFLLVDIWLIVFESAYRTKIPTLLGLTKAGKIRKARFAKALYDNYFIDDAPYADDFLFAY